MLDYLLRQILLLIQPFGLIWLTLIVVSIALWRRKLRALAATTSGLVVLMIVVGSSGFPGWLLSTLERPFAGVKPESLPVCDAVVTLGGSIRPSRYEAGGFHLTRAGDRLIMALELMRLGKARTLVIGGAAAKLDGEMRVESELIRGWLELGVFLAETRPSIIALRRCTDTHDEALEVRALARERGWQRVILVTSASHMRRALAAFRTAGIEAIPAPCNFLTDLSTAPGEAGISVPRFENLEKISVWLHEQVGWLVYRWRGWIAE